MLIDTNKLRIKELMDMFACGFISGRDVMEELHMRGLVLGISGEVETKDGKLYEEPINNRWEILDL